MKQHFTLLLISLLSMVAGQALAYDAEVDGIFYNFSGDEAEVTFKSGTGSYQGTIVIPESVVHNGKEYKVTSIGEKAFYYCTGLNSVVIPNSVIAIGKLAFESCYYLSSVNLGTSLKSIDEFAFTGCANLLRIDLPNSLEIIGKSAFWQCSSIKSIVIPDKVTEIPYSSFGGCTGLRSVVIGNSVTSMGYGAFKGCSSLSDVTIPNSVTAIGQSAFEGCSNLTSVTFGKSIKSIGYEAFSGCGNPLNIYIDDIGNWANVDFGDPQYEHNWIDRNINGKQIKYFHNGQEIKNLVIPDNAKSVNSYAFQCCNFLSVVIPNSVTTIGKSAFLGDTIQSLTIGAGVLEFNLYGDGIYAKKTIWMTNTPPKGYGYVHSEVHYVSNDLFKFTPYVEYGTLKAANSVCVYPLLSSMFAIDGVKYAPTSMADRTCDAFDAVYDESAKLTKLGTTVTYRGVQFTVNNVRPYTCCGNTFVENVELTNLPSINDHVFDGCTNLKAAKLPETVTFLGESSFQDCQSLQEIAIPAATTEVKYNAFKGCTSLKDVTMNDGAGVLSLGYNYEREGYDSAPLFEDCPLDKVYIGRNISYSTKANEGYSPFYRNTSLRSVEITDQETEISENEFYGCTGLKKVRIGDGVTTFGNWAFSGCSSLDYFEFGSSVKTIGKEAFSDCAKVTRIISHTVTPPTCGSQAMDDINKWDCTLIVPDGSVAAYQAADQWKEFLFVEDFTTDIHTVSQPSTSCPAVIHSLSGQRLTTPRKGINIIDGKKVVVK